MTRKKKLIFGRKLTVFARRRRSLLLENPLGIAVFELGEQIFIKIENFSDSLSNVDLPGPSANS